MMRGQKVIITAVVHVNMLRDFPDDEGTEGPAHRQQQRQDE